MKRLLPIILIALIVGIPFAWQIASAADTCLNIFANVRPLNSFMNVRATPAVVPPIVRTVVAGTTVPIVGLRFNTDDQHNWYEVCGGGWVRDDVIVLATASPTRVTGPSATPSPTATQTPSPTITRTGTPIPPIPLSVISAELHLHQQLATAAAFTSQLHATDAAEIAAWMTSVARP